VRWSAFLTNRGCYELPDGRKEGRERSKQKTGSVTIFLCLSSIKTAKLASLNLQLCLGRHPHRVDASCRLCCLYFLVRVGEAGREGRRRGEIVARSL